MPEPVSFSMEGGKLYLQSKREKEIKNISLWMTAFHILMSIALEKYPCRAIGMLHFCERVRMAARDFPAEIWVKFNQQARLRQATDPTRPWATLDRDLWFTELTKASDKTYLERVSSSYHSNKSDKAPNSPELTTMAKAPFIKDKMPPGKKQYQNTCHFFNRGYCTKGTNCTFSHKCGQYFSSWHLIIKCPKNQ